MQHLVLNLVAAFLVVLVGWIFIRSPKGKKMTINALCEHDFSHLYLRVLKCRTSQDARDLENAVDDFYSEYAGRTVRGLEYANELYTLLAQMQMLHVN